MRVKIFSLLILPLVWGCSLSASVKDLIKNPFAAEPQNKASDTAALVPEGGEKALIETGEPQAADSQSADSPVATPQKEVPLAAQTKPVAISAPKPVVPPAPTQAVELVWQRPTEPVILYHLHYGTDAQNLNKYVRVPASNLEKVEDPSSGPLFRYRLAGVPLGVPIYVSMQAENQYGMSAPTEPMLIPAE